MSPRPFKLRHPEAPESDVQSTLLTVLEMHPRVAWAYRMNTGAGHLAHKRKDSPGGWIVSKTFLRFGFPGMSDILGQMKDGRFLAVEAKRQSGELSGDQRAFLENVRRNGGIGIEARDARELWHALDNA